MLLVKERTLRLCKRVNVLGRPGTGFFVFLNGLNQGSEEIKVSGASMTQYIISKADKMSVGRNI